MSDIRVLTGPEVAAHASRESCWIIVHGAYLAFGSIFSTADGRLTLGKVYDVTDFLDGEPFCRSCGMSRVLNIIRRAPGWQQNYSEVCGKGRYVSFCQIRGDIPFINWSHSEAYDPIHPPDAITTNLPLNKQ